MREIYSKICRLCLQITNDLVPIYESTDDISSTIMACTLVKISKDDGFPENICTSCKQKLNSSYEFKQLCETSDDFLRSYDFSTDIENDLNSLKNGSLTLSSNNVLQNEEEFYIKEENEGGKSIADQFEVIYAYSESADDTQCIEDDIEIIEEKPKIPDLVPVKRKAAKKKPGPKKAKCETNTECSICHKVFSHAGNLRRHTLIHEGIKRHTCQLCNKKFTRSSTLKDHLDIFHSKHFKQYTCKFCDYTHIRRNELAMHMALKHNIGSLNKPRFTKPKPQTCTICNKTLSSTAALNMHMKIHNNVREHLCRHCGRAFHHKAGLENHERIHTGEKPYMCPHCPKSFSQQIGLRIHERTHTGEKPYQCKVCLKSFSQQTHLRTHSFTHSGERRYACDMCDKRFALREGLRYHQMAHTGETPFKCTLCNKGFYIHYKLKVHMAKSHHIKVEVIKR